MKSLFRTLVHFNLISATFNPLKLYSYSLESIKGIFDEDTVGIISRIYPMFFDDHITPEYSGLYDLIYLGKISEKEIDLANLKIERIPISIASKMSNVEKLNLSGNPNLKLDEEWFSYFFDNLKELSVNNCNLTNENLKAISNMKSLERLDLSDTEKFDIKMLTPILINLKHLDVSYSCFTISELEHILDRADKLESINFSENNLFKESNLIAVLSKHPNLKTLKLSRCGLSFKDLENIVQIKTLEEVDLSKNYLNSSEQKLSEIEIKQKEEESNGTMNVFHKRMLNVDISIENNLIEYNQLNISKSRLKKINVKNCYLENEKFIESLFDIEGLEVLYLENNILDFDLKEILNGRAKDSLKELNISSCRIKSAETLKFFADFKKLEKLDISDNIFVDFPEGFNLGQSRHSLKYLNIGYNKLNSSVFRSITECTCLEKLDLSWSIIKNVTPSSLKLDNLKSTLKILNFRGCGINHDWFKVFTDFPKLEELDFSYNKFSLITKEYSLGCSRESLKEINLRKSKINHLVLPDITDCPRLLTLDISYNNLGTLPIDFKFGRSKESLKELYIDDTGIDSKGLQVISECKKIEILWINGNNFHDLPDNFSFRSLEMSLREIIIFDSLINFSFLKAVSKCEKLESLHLGYYRTLDVNNPEVLMIMDKLKNSVKKFYY